MKLSLITFIRLKYYYSAFTLMRNFGDDIVDRDAVEMFECWEVVYRNKIKKFTS